MQLIQANDSGPVAAGSRPGREGIRAHRGRGEQAWTRWNARGGAGHTIAVLFRVYAKVLAQTQERANHPIDAAMREWNEPE
ncbi:MULTISPECIES: hypothetical protein [unclassified Streptomyces]|uniref:hypothetical protein n=1 Tax=unclassified Streptomyces TaxID=2593676 RepID=UPI002DD818AE|nr:hypothetical protein [Streptomyces sp. NBC_01760]